MSRWPIHRAYFWHEAPAFRPLLGLCAGILFFDWIPFAASVLQVFVALILFNTVFIAAGISRRRKVLLSRFFPVCFWLFFAFAGWAICRLNDPKGNPRWFGHHLEASAAWLVRLEEDPQPRANSYRVRAEVFKRLDSSRQISVTGRTLLYLSKECKELPGAGDTLLVAGDFTAVRNSSNPFAFDNQKFQRRQGIYFQQFLRPESYRIIASMKPSEHSLFDQVHRWCGLQLNRYIHDSATKGLLQAMILGDEQALDPELRQTYSDTGVVHIVSISGAHVAVLFLVVAGLLRWIRGRKGQWLRYGIGMLLVWWYVLMAGAPPSALRSAVMFSVIALSALSGMQGQGLNTLASAAMILLIGNPNWLFSVGFQLSFLAVLSMMLFYPPFYSLWTFKSRLIGKLGQALVASLAAEVLTAPLVIYYFHNFPLYFLVANLLAGILVGMLALIGGMAVILTSFIPPLSKCIAWALQECVQFFNQAMQQLQLGTPAVFRHLQIDSMELLFIYLIIGACAVWVLKNEKRALWFVFSSLLVLIFLLNVDALNALKQDRFVVYENGSKPLVERIRGDYYQRIFGDNADFATRPAHIGWNAWRESKREEDSVMMIGKCVVLVLNDFNFHQHSKEFPIDVLVWAGTKRIPKPEELMGIFHPKKLVFASRLSPLIRKAWTDSCAQHGIALHEVAKDGAFVLDALP
jgi:competence protein ComEC